VSAARALAIASELVWVRLELLLDLVADDVLVGVQADRATGWSLETLVTSWAWRAWWSLSAVHTVDTAWTHLTLWAWGAIGTAGAGITSVTWLALVTWSAGSALLAWLTWLTVLARVTGGTGWTWETLLTGWAASTWLTASARLTVLTWVTVRAVRAWRTLATWLTNWTASLALWTGRAWRTAWTLSTWRTSGTLSTVRRNIGGGETVAAVHTGGTSGTWGTVHTASARNTRSTLSAWLTASTGLTSWTLVTHLTALLLALAGARSLAASRGLLVESWALVGNLVKTFDVSWDDVGGATGKAAVLSLLLLLVLVVDNVTFSISVLHTDAVLRDDLLEEVLVWAAREARLRLGAVVGDRVHHKVDGHTAELGRLIGDGKVALLDDATVGDDHEDASDAVVARVSLEHVERLVETERDDVTVALELGAADRSSEGISLVGTDKVGDYVDSLGVGDDGNLTVAGVRVVVDLVLSVTREGGARVERDVAVVAVVAVLEDVVDHTLYVGLHLVPVGRGASGAVHHHNNLDWARLGGLLSARVAALARAVGHVVTGGRAHLAHVSSDELLFAGMNSQRCG